MDMQADGDLFIGEDVANPGTTYLIIAVNPQTYNSEALDAGDMIIGDNSALKANIFWDKSAGRLNFRGGQTTELFIDTDGDLTAGAGDVTINSNGIILNPGTGATQMLKVIDGGAIRILELYANTDPGASSQGHLTARGRGGAGPITHEGLLELIAITDDGAAWAGAASVTITMETDNDRITITAGQLNHSAGAAFNESGGDNDFKIESENNDPIFFVDANADSIGIDTNTPDTDTIMDMSPAIKPLRLPNLTSTNRDNVTAANGMIIYNSTTDTIQAYFGGAWTDL